MYISGKKDGEARYYDESGNLVREAMFTKDILEGQEIVIYPDGGKQREFFYIDGLEHGECYTYFKNGEVESVTEYVKGKIVKGPITYAQKSK